MSTQSALCCLRDVAMWWGSDQRANGTMRLDLLPRTHAQARSCLPCFSYRPYGDSSPELQVVDGISKKAGCSSVSLLTSEVDALNLTDPSLVFARAVHFTFSRLEACVLVAGSLRKKVSLLGANQPLCGHFPESKDGRVQSRLLQMSLLPHQTLTIS